MVATILIAVPMLPKPETSSASVQKSVLWPTEKGLRSQRRVGKPPHVGRVTRTVQSVGSYQAEIEKQAAESSHPEAESIQTWKGHVPRPNHEWNQIVCESEQDRHDHEEDHRGSVHGEHPIEHLRRNKVVVRADQLDADNRCLDPADHKKNQGVDDVHNAQSLVIHCRYPFVEVIDE